MFSSEIFEVISFSALLLSRALLLVGRRVPLADALSSLDDECLVLLALCSISFCYHKAAADAWVSHQMVLQKMRSYVLLFEGSGDRASDGGIVIEQPLHTSSLLVLTARSNEPTILSSVS